MKIPLLDLEAQHSPLRPEIDAAMSAVMSHGRFVGGPEVGEFERAFAVYCRADHCVGVSSGTDAITVGLLAAGVGPGDEVITTSLTFIATVESICHVGATPVLVDPRPDTALQHVDDVAAAITHRTAAVIAVHLYGQPVDLNAHRALCDARGLLLVEDAAQAHGARWGESIVGSVGDFSAFSFFPGKNLGALGDAGAITTNNDEIAVRARSLRDHGRAGKYLHDHIGSNSRLDTIQAAVLLVKLPHLDGWNAGRRRQAASYDAAFAEVDGIEPIATLDEALPVYHQYVVRVRDRDAAQRLLAERGVSAGVHYPVPLHMQPALKGVANHSDLPNSETLATSVLSLPVFPELRDDEREWITAALLEHVDQTTGSRAAVDS